MCDCKGFFETALVRKVSAQKPQATHVQASLNGYGLNFQTGTMRPALSAVVTFLLPKAKGGGLRQATEKFSAVATYCPFCGERYEDEPA